MIGAGNRLSARTGHDGSTEHAADEFHLFCCQPDGRYELADGKVVGMAPDDYVCRGYPCALRPLPQYYNDGSSRDA